MDSIWLKFPDGTTKEFKTPEEAMAAAEEARQKGQRDLLSPPTRGTDDPSKRPPAPGLGEIWDTVRKHLPEALPMIATSLTPGGLASIPLKMGLAGIAGFGGNLAAGKPVKESASEAGLSSLEYGAAPEVVGGLLGKMKLPNKITDVGWRSKITDAPRRAAAVEEAIGGNINSVGKAERALEEQIADAGLEAQASKKAIMPRQMIGKSAKAVDEAHMATPRVPTPSGAKHQAEELIGGLANANRPIPISDAVDDIRALATRGRGNVVAPVRETVKDAVGSLEPDVVAGLNREDALADALAALKKKPGLSMWEAGPAAFGGISGAIGGHGIEGALGGLAGGALMHAVKSPSAWVNAGLAAKGVEKATPAVMRGATFLAKDAGPLQELLKMLSGGDQ